MKSIEFPKALRTNTLVGREKEKKLIKEAIEAWGSSRFVCFTGDGGLGKTRLLEQVTLLMGECSPDASCLCSGIMDFYHAEFHLGSGIERAILHTFDPQEKFFSTYREERRHYDALRASGADPQRLLGLRRTLRGLFMEDFNAFARHTRPILLFDTIELIQYEGDYTQQLCPDIFDAEKELWGEAGNWLLQVLPRLENTVVVLAGRPGAAAFQKELDKALDNTLHSYALGAFTSEETLAYLDALAETLKLGGDELGCQTVMGIHSEVGNRLYTLTRGEPLPLSMIVDMLYIGTIRPVDLDHLTFAQIPAQSASWMREFERDTMYALPYINLLRKGVNAERLAIVTGWDEVRCQNVLEPMRRFAFVKQRPGTDLLFLHDKMYEWIDQNQDLAGFVDLEDSCIQIINYYDRIIAGAQPADPAAVDALRVEQLYYHLLRNQEEGLSVYQEWADEALSGGRIEYEMSLRNEMLRFFKPQDPGGQARYLTAHLERRIARDSGTRWVLRFLRHNDNVQARQVADRVWDHGDPPFDRREPSLFESVLQVYRGEALAYLGQMDRAIDDLSRAVDELQGLQSNSSQVQRYLLGLAHKNRGYVYARQRGYEQAIEDYLVAIRILTPLAENKMRRAQLELAHTQRNLAFIYGERGEKIDAEYYCEQALSGFEALQYHWGEALTLNVWGGIAARFHDPYTSARLCKEALQLFTMLDDRRGIGLSSLWLGRAYRRQGAYSPSGNIEGSETLFKQAQGLYEIARGIFEQEVEEPIRLIEASAEEGKLYRDWLKVAYGKKEQNELDRLSEQSETRLKEAIRLADQNKMLAESADCHQDLGNLYQFLGRYDEVWAILQEAEAMLPQGCVLTPENPTALLKCPAPGYLEILGKIYMARGDVVYAQGDIVQAVELWTLAAGYFDLFSSNARRFVEELVTDVGKKLFNEPSGRLKDLEQHCERIEQQYGLKRTYWHDELARLAERRKRG